MPDPLPNFSDPALKAAVARAAGTHRASDALRAKVSAALAGGPESPAIDSVQPRLPSRHPLLRYAIAAAIALPLISIAILQTRHYLHEQHEQHEKAEFLADNTALIDTMITVASARPADAVAVPFDNLPAALGRTLKLPDPTSKGFALSDVALTSIGGKPAARLEYVRGTDTAILLLIDASLLAEKEEAEPYVVERAGQIIAGVAFGDSLQCFVAPKDKLDEETLAELATTFRK